MINCRLASHHLLLDTVSDVGEGCELVIAGLVLHVLVLAAVEIL